MFNTKLQIAIAQVANKHNLDPVRLTAVVEVESTGRLFWTVGGINVPPARPEAHYFYRLLTSSKEQQIAVQQGLAHPKMGGIQPPSTYSAIYNVIHRMEIINRAAARMSCSWGCGQVMGEHWHKLGYSSVDEMVEANDTAEGQVDCMVRYINVFGLRAALQKGSTSAASWSTFARGYNGPAYKRMDYHTKMATAYRKYAAQELGDHEGVDLEISDSIREMQVSLYALDYYKGKLDGIDGPKTRLALRAFQQDEGLVVDGIFGHMTERRLADAIARLEDEQDSNVGGVAGTVAIGVAVGERVVNSVVPISASVYAVLGAVVCVAAAIVLVTILRKRRRAEAS